MVLLNMQKQQCIHSAASKNGPPFRNTIALKVSLYQNNGTLHNKSGIDHYRLLMSSCLILLG